MKKIVIAIFILGFSIIVGIKFLNHEKNQQNKIVDLYSQVTYLNQKLTQTEQYFNFEAKYKKSSYNYLAIGNSLTLITAWGRGACATELDNDYFNLVVKWLKKNHGDVVAYPYNFKSWEILSERDKTFDLLKNYLVPELNLVTIQLGENVQNLKSYEKDLESLICYIKRKSPDARILVLGDFWSFEKTELRKLAAKNTNVEFVDISKIVGKKEFQSKAGTKLKLESGETVEVFPAAETHPGDLGMMFIADRIIEVLKNF